MKRGGKLATTWVPQFMRVGKIFTLIALFDARKESTLSEIYLELLSVETSKLKLAGVATF